MATPTEDRQLALRKDQGDSAHVNDVAGTEKPGVMEEEEGDIMRDYTGTARKSDPEEIRLVRKLDWCIMVSCSSFYQPETRLNPLTPTLASPLHHVFSELCGS